MKKITLTLLALVCALCCALGLAACDRDTQTVAVESVTLNKTTLTLEIDDTETLTATVTPDNATDKTVTWSSSAPTIASVDSTGKVTAKAEGTATITAKTANDKTATCAVTVNAPAPITTVTAEQWAQILESANNYTYTMTLPSMSTTNKVVGNKWQQTDGEGVVNQIVVKDNDTYYVYVQDTETEVWTRMTVVGDAQSPMVQSMDFAQTVLTVCKDDFSAFTYADSKYTATEIDKTATIGTKLQNVEVIFAQGQLVSVKFGFDEVEYEFTDFGSTTVTLPTTYTERND